MITPLRETQSAWVVFVCLILALLTLCLASVAQAQSVVNPTRIEWDAPDHAITANYDIGYFMGTATTPVQTSRVAKAQVTASGASYTVALPRPVLGNFTAKMRACGLDAGGIEICSAWSDPSGPFALSPRPIAGLKVVP